MNDEPTLDQKIAFAQFEAARAAKRADEAWKKSHPDRVAFFVKAPGTGRHMALPDHPLVDETAAWLDRSFGPYPARHKATLTPAQAAAYRRLWGAVKEHE